MKIFDIRNKIHLFGNKKKVFSIFVLGLLTGILFITGITGCNSNGASADPSPLIVINYYTYFAGEAPSGYLNLSVEMDIENQGYESFDASPSNFRIKVNDYAYTAVELLESEVLADGDKINFSLTFQVPPQAKVPETGFDLIYAGQMKYNIRWIESDSPASLVNSNTEPQINIEFSKKMMWLSAPGTQYLTIEPPGKLFLVVEMTIKNTGYESFNTNSKYFSLSINNPFLTEESQVQEELIDWRILDIPNGGSFTGSLVFPIPTDAAQSFYQWIFEMKYSGDRAYNVNWRETELSMCTIDGELTDLDAVNLRNGETMNGKLVYAITPELADATARYEMRYENQYSRDLSYNIQWFNSPAAVSDVDRNPLKQPAVKITYSTGLLVKENGLLYLVVNVLIENIGYDSFLTTPAYFIVEVSH